MLTVSAINVGNTNSAICAIGELALFFFLGFPPIQSNRNLLCIHQNALSGTLKSLTLTSAPGGNREKYLLSSFPVENSLWNDEGILSACCDQRVHTQTLLNKTANIPEGNHLVMNEITKMRTSNAVVLNTRPDLAAPYRKSFRPALLSTGMAGCSTHSSSSFLSLSCGQWKLFAVFLFSGNVISMMVPSTTSFQSCWWFCAVWLSVAVLRSQPAAKRWRKSLMYKNCSIFKISKMDAYLSCSLVNNFSVLCGRESCVFEGDGSQLFES